jgi:hypothetical protein
VARAAGPGGWGGAPGSRVAEEVAQGVGAYVMGRNMFDPGRGEWDENWRGWWGEDPPPDRRRRPAPARAPTRSCR